MCIYYFDVCPWNCLNSWADVDALGIYFQFLLAFCYFLYFHFSEILFAGVIQQHVEINEYFVCINIRSQVCCCYLLGIWVAVRIAEEHHNGDSSPGVYF